MTGGWNFVIAAYAAATLLLGGYSLTLVKRLRREREITRERDARLANVTKGGSGGESAPR
jgi:hypothetical protein